MFKKQGNLTKSDDFFNFYCPINSFYEGVTKYNSENDHLLRRMKRRNYFLIRRISYSIRDYKTRCTSFHRIGLYCC